MTYSRKPGKLPSCNAHVAIAQKIYYSNLLQKHEQRELHFDQTTQQEIPALD